MKKYISLTLSLALATLLCACGGDSSATSSSSSQSSSVTQSNSASSQSDSDSSTQAHTADVAAIAETLAQAASLGVTLEFTQIDLTAQFGISKDDAAAFAGFYSQTVSQNGGEVMVVQAAAGKAAAVKAALEDYRNNTVNNDLYIEFADARENVKKARIEASGDLVIYAVSAAGTDEGWQTLDAAIAKALGS